MRLPFLSPWKLASVDMNDIDHRTTAPCIKLINATL